MSRELKKFYAIIFLPLILMKPADKYNLNGYCSAAVVLLSMQKSIKFSLKPALN